MVGVENQLEMACSEKQLEMANSENQFEMACSEKQLEMASSENQVEMACSEKQLEMASSENQLEMAISEKQLEAVSSENQLEMVGTEGQLENIVGAENQLEISQKSQMATVSTEGEIERVSKEGSMERLTVEEEKEKWITHYSSHQKILLVGEGDFSFAACLGKAFGSAASMVATSLDSKECLVATYSRAAENLKKLKDLGCTILHEVNAHTMGCHPLLHEQWFDRIVFNFPHAGFHYLYREHDIRLIESHQKLVKGFLRSANDMLSKNGEAHVTHKTAHPFDRWEIEKLAEDVGLCLIE
ncbi:hypothetical protein BDE02_01G377500 [Populus trichocarpa]|nr:hypothetical protein BDE02_01G377500 [Populus trichocarpa]